jgi:HEPN domain-containing protein
MSDLVKEWIDKAEGDRQTARREAAVTERPNWDAVCFHAQQAVEKYLKALLQQEANAFTRTHDLGLLSRPLCVKYPDLAAHSDGLEWLAAFAVEVRYPGESALEEDAKQSIVFMEEIIRVIALKLSNPSGASLS